MNQPVDNRLPNAFGCLAPLIAGVMATGGTTATTTGVTPPLRIGVMGGTFDPVHFGHLMVAQAAYEQHDLAGVLFMPCSFPFYKDTNLASDAATRLTMLELALGGDDRFAVSRIETDRTGYSYTYKTLEMLSELTLTAVGYFLIVGADALKDLPKWRNAGYIAQTVTVLYAARPGSDLALVEAQAQQSGFRILKIEAPLIEISSSTIRARAKAGLSLRYHTPDAVVDYINQHRDTVFGG